MTVVLSRLGGAKPKDVAILAGGTGLSQTIAIFVAPILTRLYGPESFGTLAVYSAVVATLVVVSGLRYEQAIPLSRTQGEALNLLVATTGLVVVFATLVLVVIANLVHLGSHLPVVRAGRSLMWVVPIGILLGGWIQVTSAWFTRIQAYRTISIAEVSRSSSQAITQVPLGLLGLGALGLVAGQLCGQLVQLVCITRDLVAGGRIRVKGHLSLGRMRRIMWLYRRFPTFAASASLLNQLSLALPSLMLLALYGPRDTGYFFLCYRVLGMPLSVIGLAVAKVYYGRASQQMRESRSTLESDCRRTVLNSLAIGALPALVLLVWAPEIFELVFGDTWRRSGNFAQVLVPAFLAQFAIMPVSATLNIVGKQRRQLALDSVRLTLSGAALLLPSLLGYSAIATAAVYSLALVIVYLLQFRLITVAARRMDVGFRVQPTL